MLELESQEAVARGQPEVPHGLPIQPRRRTELHLAAHAETADVHQAVDLELLADAVIGDADERVPQPGLARELGQVRDPDVVIEREASDAARHEQVLEDAEPQGPVAVDHVRGDVEERPFRAVAADRHPQPVDVNAPRAIGGRDTRQEGAVELRVDDRRMLAAGAASAATSAAPATDVPGDVDVDAYVHGNPREHGIDAESPVARRVLCRGRRGERQQATKGGADEADLPEHVDSPLGGGHGCAAAPGLVSFHSMPS